MRRAIAAETGLEARSLAWTSALLGLGVGLFLADVLRHPGSADTERRA